jgi:hypothetical protein
MATIRKQYSANYQVIELTQEYDENGDVLLISSQMDDIAIKELEKMVELTASITKQATPTPQASTGALASEKQLALIKKNLNKCKMIAEELGISLNSKTLTVNEAKQIIDKLFAKNDSGF